MAYNTCRSECSAGQCSSGLEEGLCEDELQRMMEIDEEMMKALEWEDFGGFNVQELVDEVTKKDRLSPCEDGDGECLIPEEAPGDKTSFAGQDALTSDVPMCSSRQTSTKTYEEDALSENEYLSCDDCNVLYRGECPVHGPLSEFDSTAGYDQASLAHTPLPVPAQLSIGPSVIPGAGLGVFATTFINKVSSANFCRCGCGESFMEEKSFHVHLKHSSACAKANPQTFACCKYNQHFTQLEYLQQHIQNHENLAPLNNGKQCPYCGKSLSNSGNLQRHLRTHTGDKPYECEHCGKGFSQSSLLQRHLKTHAGDKPYKCDHCGKGFYRSDHLQSHLRTHTGEKPYKCEHCGRSFNQSGTLQAHLRTHTGDKPYKCELCGKSFSLNSTLQKHLRTHTGDKPNKCEHCGKSFAQSSTLQRHLRTHVQK